MGLNGMDTLGPHWLGWWLPASGVAGRGGVSFLGSLSLAPIGSVGFCFGNRGTFLFHFAENPHEIVIPVRQVSIFASGWLLREQQTTGRSSRQAC